jgi:outer membrane protein assembly factor BamB
LQWLGWFVVPAIFPQAPIVALLSGVIGGLAILVWWLLFSRAPWLERIAALVLIVLALIGTKRLVHESIAGGAMGMLLYVLAIPVFSMGLVLWAVVTRHFSTAKRRLAFVPMLVIGCGVFMFLRTGGLTAEFDNDLHWRWSKTPEQTLLAQGNEDTAAPASNVSASTSIETGWSGFRGPQRDSTVRGVKIKTDWSASPPVQLWRRPIGPAWSSFAVQNGR